MPHERQLDAARDAPAMLRDEVFSERTHVLACTDLLCIALRLRDVVSNKPHAILLQHLDFRRT